MGRQDRRRRPLLQNGKVSGEIVEGVRVEDDGAVKGLQQVDEDRSDVLALAEAAARHEDGGFPEEFLQGRQRVSGQCAIRGSGQGQAHGLRQVGRDGRVGRSRVRGGQKAGAGTQGRARAEAGGTGHAVAAAKGQDVARVVLVGGPFPDRQERGRLVPGERMEMRGDDGIGLRQDADVEEAYIATVFPGGIQNMKGFQGADGDGPRSLHGGPQDFSGVRHDAARNVDGNGVSGGFVHGRKDPGLELVRGAPEPDAEHAVDQYRRGFHGFGRLLCPPGKDRNGEVRRAAVILDGIGGFRLPKRQDERDVISGPQHLPGDDESIATVLPAAADHGHRTVLRRIRLHDEFGTAGPRLFHEGEELRSDFVFSDFDGADLVRCRDDHRSAPFVVLLISSYHTRSVPATKK